MLLQFEPDLAGELQKDCAIAVRKHATGEEDLPQDRDFRGLLDT